MGVHSGGEGTVNTCVLLGAASQWTPSLEIHNKQGAMELTNNSLHEGKDNDHLVCRGQNRRKGQATCLKSHSEISTTKMEVLGSRIHTVGWVLIQQQ